MSAGCHNPPDMANRPFFRRRASDGPDGQAGPPPDGGGQSADGERGPGRRRRRGRRRGQRPGAALQGSAEGQSEPSSAPAAEAHELARTGLSGGPEGGRRRRRRGGRGRRRRPDDGSVVSTPQVETAPGELPADYISLPVERGMPVLYEPRETELEEAEQLQAPRKSKRVNSGKLFWYIRSKSYVPIPELRRRFEITPDDMATIQDDGQKVYIGLPQDVADVVANLRRQQKIGLECSADFTVPVVIGIYPMYH